MTQPLTPPTFSGGYTTPLTDIGSGYAAGITSAGQSIAGAIGAVMGGYNQRTGEVQEGILGQKKSAEDQLDMMHAHNMIGDDEYAKAKASSLGAQQKMIGQYASEFNTKLQAQLEQDRALAVANAQNTAALQRTNIGESGAMDRTKYEQDQANERARIAAQPKTEQTPPLVRRPPTTIPQSPIFNPPPTPKLSLGIP